MTALQLPTRTDYSPRSIGYDDLDGVTEGYREQLIRLMAIQAQAELKAATEAAPWVSRAPDFRRRRLLAKVIAEEAAHSAMIYAILERVGCSEAQACDIAEGRVGKPMHEASGDGPDRVGDPDNEWIDIMLNHTFLDRAGQFMVANFAESSFTPWADANRAILRDEKGHVAFGDAELRTWLRSQANDDATADRVSTWYARGLNFFGPPSSRKAEVLRSYGLKPRDNDQLREAYRVEVENLFNELGCPGLLRLRNTAFPY